MAYKNKVITPPKYVNQDTLATSQFYRGFSTVNDTASVQLYDNDLIKQDLLNYFATRKGERLMNPTFGTIIWDLLYDPLTSDLKEAIKDDITQILSSDPRLNPLSVNVVEQDYGLLLEITVTYVDSNQSENMRLSFNKELGLVTQ